MVTIYSCYLSSPPSFSFLFSSALIVKIFAYKCYIVFIIKLLYTRKNYSHWELFTQSQEVPTKRNTHTTPHSNWQHFGCQKSQPKISYSINDWA